MSILITICKSTLRAHLARFHNGKKEAVRLFAVDKLKDPRIATKFAEKHRHKASIETTSSTKEYSSRLAIGE